MTILTFSFFYAILPILKITKKKKKNFTHPHVSKIFKKYDTPPPHSIEHY